MNIGWSVCFLCRILLMLRCSNSIHPLSTRRHSTVLSVSDSRESLLLIDDVVDDNDEWHDNKWCWWQQWLMSCGRQRIVSWLQKSEVNTSHLPYRRDRVERWVIRHLLSALNPIVEKLRLMRSAGRTCPKHLLYKCFKIRLKLCAPHHNYPVCQWLLLTVLHFVYWKRGRFVEQQV